MPRKHKAISIILNAAIFILLEVAALVMLSHRGELQHIWIARTGHAIMDKVWGRTDNIRYYFSLARANEELDRENSNLRNSLAVYMTAVSEMNGAGHTADIKTVPEFNMIPAMIVKLSRNKAHNYFIINKGAEDGVRPQSGVITSKGVVGIIDAVENHHSFGLLLLNSDVSVSARIGHEGVTGRLSWDGISKDRAVFGDIPLQYHFAPGDTIWTSGFSAIFPPDVPLGTIRDSRIVDGAANQIGVDLFMDFGALRYVTVTDNSARDAITFLENFENSVAQ